MVGQRTEDAAAAADAQPLSGRACEVTDDEVGSVILVRLGNWIGDAVMAVPALPLLERYSHRLPIIGKRWAADLLRLRLGVAISPTGRAWTPCCSAPTRC